MGVIHDISRNTNLTTIMSLTKLVRTLSWKVGNMRNVLLALASHIWDLTNRLDSILNWIMTLEWSVNILARNRVSGNSRLNKIDAYQYKYDYLRMYFMDSLENSEVREPGKGISGWEARLAKVHVILKLKKSKYLEWEWGWRMWYIFSCLKYLKAKVSAELHNDPFDLFKDFRVLNSFCKLSLVSKVEFLDRGK